MRSQRRFISLATAVLVTLFPQFPLPSPLLPAQAQTTEARKAEADRLFQQGVQQHQISQFEVALQSWQQALSIYRAINDRRGEGIALGNLGIAYDALGNYGKAIEYQEQSLAIAREINNRLGEGQSLGNLGLAYHALGNYGKAIEYQEQSLAIAREVNDQRGEGNALGNLGIAHYRLGNYGKAIEYQEQSLALAREINDRLGEGIALGNLGIAYDALGNYSKAVEYHQQRLAIAREINDRLGEGQSLGNLGNAYYVLGNYSKAVEYHQQSLAIAREINNRLGEGQSLGNLGNAYYALGNYGKAIEYHQQRLAIVQEINDRLGEGQSLGNLGLAYFSLGNYGKAIEYHQQRLAIAQEINDRLGEGTALNNLGAAFFESGNLAAAEKGLFESIAVWELLRQTGAGNDANKVSIFEQQAHTYRTLQQVLVAQNKLNAALEIAERGRARAFVELLTKRLATDTPANQTNNQLNSSIAPSVAQLQQIAKTQNATLIQYSIIYDQFNIQDREQPQESELYIWVIQPTGEITFRKADLKPLWQQQNTSLSELVTATRQVIGARSRATLVANVPPEAKERQQKRLQQLHTLLVKPIADLLPKDPNQRVIFIPQADLFLVPFPALQDSNGQYLIEQHTLLTAPSIQVLELTHQQRQHIQSSKSGVNGALVVGNPTMPKIRTEAGGALEQLSNLSGAEHEAIAIAALLKTKAITGSQATKSAILSQLSQARFVHLATHGLLDDFKGLGVPGAIALGPDGTGKGNDGLLTADEILDLKLTAELVVLSACDTGRGRITGDGVIGLSRSLITAGVPSIVVSLWKVPDNSTAFLMTEFYKNLQQHPNKAEALRQAMLTTKAKYSDPLDWAAFTLIGEAE